MAIREGQWKRNPLTLGWGVGRPGKLQSALLHSELTTSCVDWEKALPALGQTPEAPCPIPGQLHIHHMMGCISFSHLKLNIIIIIIIRLLTPQRQKLGLVSASIVASALSRKLLYHWHSMTI